MRVVLSCRKERVEQEGESKKIREREKEDVMESFLEQLLMFEFPCFVCPLLGATDKAHKRGWQRWALYVTKSSLCLLSAKSTETRGTRQSGNEEKQSARAKNKKLRNEARFLREEEGF